MFFLHMVTFSSTKRVPQDRNFQFLTGEYCTYPFKAILQISGPKLTQICRDVTKWSLFWTPFVQYCFKASKTWPKPGPKMVRTDARTDARTDGRTDAHQNFEAPYTKALRAINSKLPVSDRDESERGFN